eukprot:gene31382-38762_t
MRSQQKDRSSSNLNGTSSSNRPTSAGATRSSRNNNFSYAQQPSASNGSSQSSNARNNTGTTNMYTAQVNNPQPNVTASGLMGQGYTNQRPSSAGHSRPQASGSNGASSHLNVGNPGALAHLLGSHQYPPSAAGNHIPINLTGGGIVNGTAPSNSGRPKSASSVRRTADPSAQQTQQKMINMQNIYGVNGNMTAQQMYNIQQQQQQLQYKQQQQQLAEQQQLHLQQQQQLAAAQAAQHQQQQQYHYGGSGSAAPPITQRPLSANATSHTSHNNTANTNAVYADHWSNQYKMHYNFPTNGTATGGGVGTNGLLRTAVDLSHKYENAGATAVANAHVSGNQPIAQLTGLDNDDEGGDLDLGADTNQRHNAALANGNNRIPLRDENDNGEDDEMDGKQLALSSYEMISGQTRSHPEVSLTGPHRASSGRAVFGRPVHIALDVRNTSLDSFSEDHIVVGLST